MSKINHVAIIMDGNGRWGLSKGRSRNHGHLQGIKTVETVIKSAIKKKISNLTLYTFSTENWKRPESEINFLFDLIRKSLRKRLNKITKEGIKINIIGNRKRLPADIKKTLRNIEKKTSNNLTISINLALNYGSKEEILKACKALRKDKKCEINDKSFSSKLYTKDIPDPEILIRTGGTKRLSNFLLWQLAYTEIFFIEKMWPDFKAKDFTNIVKKFYSIKRNFGKI